MRLNILEKRRRAQYDNIGSVYCPILDKDVRFAADGFFHITHRPNGQPRNVNERYMKLFCLIHAPNVIEHATEVSRVRRQNQKIKGKMRNVTLFELVHKVQKDKYIRVVVRRIGKGLFRFHSIMPHNNKSRHKKNTR